MFWHYKYSLVIKFSFEKKTLPYKNNSFPVQRIFFPSDSCPKDHKFLEASAKTWRISSSSHQRKLHSHFLIKDLLRSSSHSGQQWPNHIFTICFYREIHSHCIGSSWTYSVNLYFLKRKKEWYLWMNPHRADYAETITSVAIRLLVPILHLGSQHKVVPVKMIPWVIFWLNAIQFPSKNRIAA